MRSILKRFYVSLTGARWSEAMGRRLLGRRLRVLAYHDVSDAAAFEAQMRHLRRHYAPVALDDVLDAADGVRPLPRRAVWVTFDDGHPGVVRNAMPVLDQLDVRATMFVCPGLVGSTQPFWWDVVRTALDHGIHPSFEGRSWNDGQAVTALKALPDLQRRSVVSTLTKQLEGIGVHVKRRQLARDDLIAWLDSGHDIGNHTWDHPCLDRCEASEEQRQIEEADRWLHEHLPRYRPAFAYPDGKWSSAAEQTLSALDYRIAVGFDHRVARQDRSFLRLSRLRVSAEADLVRFRSIVSGLHSLPFAFVDLSAGKRSRRMRTPA